MKYIKSYENNKYDGEYWLIPTKFPHLKVALWKLNIPEEIQEKTFLNNGAIEGYSKIYIGINYNKQRYLIDDFGWMPYKSNQADNLSLLFYKNKNYNYKGELKITKKDIDDYKISKTANKFNL